VRVSTPLLGNWNVVGLNGRSARNKSRYSEHSLHDADPDAKGSCRLLLPDALSGKIVYPLLDLGRRPWSS
jgi:hypothetical protein